MNTESGLEAVLPEERTRRLQEIRAYLEFVRANAGVEPTSATYEAHVSELLDLVQNVLAQLQLRREALPLQREELHLVQPGLREFVQAEWAAGREVPYGITMLDNSPSTPEEEAWCEALVKAGR
jgi:hypothetical protein